MAHLVERRKKRRHTIGLYNELFTQKQQLEGSIINTQLEIVMGVGTVIWDIGNDKIRYPLITHLVEINLNKSTMAIEIRPRDVTPCLELDIFVNLDNPGTIELEKTFKNFQKTINQAFSPFDRSTFETILKDAVAMLDAKGVYWLFQTYSDNRTLPEASNTLKITDTWSLLVRPRNRNRFVQDLEKFEKILKNKAGNILPSAIRAILTEPSTQNDNKHLPLYRGSYIHVDTNFHKNIRNHSPQDLYFPMPYNDEQVKIVQMLECYDGVVVQGPPGTGKTHTIANIISHYFAIGKRILVTSMQEHALAVLRDKLPKEIRPLAISLLTN